METGLGALIRSARQRRGWTQEQLAEKIGVQKSYVSQWETGARKWPQEHVRAIAFHLGLSQVDMAVAAGLIDEPMEPYPLPTDPRVQEFIDLLPYLTDAALESMRMMANFTKMTGASTSVPEPKVAIG